MPGRLRAQLGEPAGLDLAQVEEAPRVHEAGLRAEPPGERLAGRPLHHVAVEERSGRRPRPAARRAASSARPRPRRRNAGCTVTVTNARSRFSRSGSRIRQKAATGSPAPAAPGESPGTYQASVGSQDQPCARWALNSASENGGSPLRVVHRVRRHVHRMTRPHDTGVRQVHALNPHPSTRHQPATERDSFSRPGASRRQVLPRSILIEQNVGHLGYSGFIVACISEVLTCAGNVIILGPPGRTTLSTCVSCSNSTAGSCRGCSGSGTGRPTRTRSGWPRTTGPSSW